MKINQIVTDGHARGRIIAIDTDKVLIEWFKGGNGHYLKNTFKEYISKDYINESVGIIN